jgi:hypothetical protein
MAAGRSALVGETNDLLTPGESNVKSTALALAAGLATLGLTGSASAQQPASVVINQGYTVYPCGGWQQPVYYSYPAYAPVYYGNTWNTGYGAGRTWRGWNVYVGSRRNYDGGPRYVRYGNIIINRRRWGDIQNYVSYGDLLRW